jgi:hypothetical protein
MGTIQDWIDENNTKTRFRSLAHTSLRTSDVRYDSTGATLYSFDDGNASLGYHQQTNSIEHPWRLFHKGIYRPRNMGGPFFTSKLAVGLPSRKRWNLFRRAAGGWISFEVKGDLFPHIDVHRLARAVHDDTLRSTDVWNEEDAMSMLDLRAIGEKIMLSVVPTSHAFDAVTALGEPITDGAIFGLPGRNLLIEGNPGGEYLNWVFGVQPTTADVQNFNTALNTYDSVIKQYLRDADKLIRRRTRKFRMQEDVTTETVNNVPVTVGGRPLSSFLAQTGPCTIKTSITRDVWYAGAFKYHIPTSLSDFEKNLFEWQRAYGIIPDPADIWNLLPFTWLSDWFTNGGNSIRHLFLQSTEGATQVYGYVMCTSQVEKTYTWTGQLRVEDVFVPCSITAVVVKTIKQRVRVTPFGVHFTGVDLTPRQLAILAALGVAK